MVSIYYFVPPQREVEIVDKIRRHEQYDEKFRTFIEQSLQDYADQGWYQASKLSYDVLKIIDHMDPEDLRVGAAGRLLQRMGPFMAPWRWAILEPSVAAQAVMHEQLLEDEMWQRSLAALFDLLHEEAPLLLAPPRDFYTALRKQVARQVTTDELGHGWSRRLKRHRETVRDPLALQEIRASISIEDLPALDELFSILPDRKQELMKLRYIEDLSVQQIADRCQLTTSAVTSHLSQARKILRQQYS
jgi:RNA polymerase sigma factor (sigma-70 family)